MDVIRGKVTEIVFKHDASRIVQTVVKYGGKKERDEVAVELKGKYREMAQNKYSKASLLEMHMSSIIEHLSQFLVKRLIKLSPSHRASILLEFQSHVLRLLLHREATSVLADAFELYANAYERTLLLRDFYGKEVALFSFTSGSEQDKELSKKGLRGILEKQDNDSRQRVLNAVKENLTSMCAQRFATR
jgi:pumilio family protein 6